MNSQNSSCKIVKKGARTPNRSNRNKAQIGTSRADMPVKVQQIKITSMESPKATGKKSMTVVKGKKKTTQHVRGKTDGDEDIYKINLPNEKNLNLLKPPTTAIKDTNSSFNKLSEGGKRIDSFANGMSSFSVLSTSERQKRRFDSISQERTKFGTQSNYFQILRLYKEDCLQEAMDEIQKQEAEDPDPAQINVNRLYIKGLVY
jgi:hypothetical protein